MKSNFQCTNFKMKLKLICQPAAVTVTAQLTNFTKKGVCIKPRKRRWLGNLVSN